MNIIEDIKNIISKFIEQEYKCYLDDNSLLLIQENKLKSVITDLYNNNNKYLKNLIRNTLKHKYKEQYPGGSVENAILDIFEDKNLNINKLIDEIKLIQNNNYISLSVPVVNNSLNLNISIINNYVVINSTNKFSIENYDDLYDTIGKYKFIYSINNKLISDYNSTEIKLKLFTSEIKDKKEVILGLYYKK